MKKILLGVNFEHESDAAIEDAYLLANYYKAAIIPIHAIEYLPRRNQQHETDLLVGQIEKMMEQIGNRLSVRGVEVYEPVIEKGDAITVLECAANTLDVDLLIIGAGVDDENHPTLGVTAKAIVRTSPVPVWISNCTTEKVDYDNISVAVDLSEHSLKTMETAIVLARAFDARLHVLHVEPEMTYYPGLFNSDVPVSPWVLSDYINDMKMGDEYDKEHRQYVLTHDVKEFLEKVDLEGVDCDVHVRSGKTSKQILDFVNKYDSGLLIMGTMGKTGFFKKLLGGTVEKVLNKLPSSMLTVPHKN